MSSRVPGFVAFSIFSLFLSACAHTDHNPDEWAQPKEMPMKVGQISYSCDGAVSNYHYTFRHFPSGVIEAEQTIFFSNGSKRIARKRTREAWKSTSLSDEMHIYHHPNNKPPSYSKETKRLTDGDLDKIRALKPGETGSFSYETTKIRPNAENWVSHTTVHREVIETRQVNVPKAGKSKGIVIDENIITISKHDKKYDKIKRTYIPEYNVNNSWVHTTTQNGEKTWHEECELVSYSSVKINGDRT